MIRNYETPMNFDIQKNIEGLDVRYSELMEIAQGSPEVGFIYINGVKVQCKDRFGGPFLVHRECLYVPIFIRRFFNSGFKLAKIDIRTLEIEMIGSVHGLIFLSRIENSKVYFFEDLDKIKSSYYNLY